MEWYKTLTSQQRFNLRVLCKDIVGVSWEDLGKIFTYRERVEILHEKLKLEGFLV